MVYRKRHAESTVKMLAKMFGGILVAGPRQVGKTTMLRKMTENIGYVSLDDLVIRNSAQEQSGTFFKDNPPPVLWMKYRKRRGSLIRSNYILTGIIKRDSSSCAARNSSG